MNYILKVRLHTSESSCEGLHRVHGPTALKPTGPAAKDCTAYTARQRSNPLAQLRRTAPRTRPDSAQTHWLTCEGLHRVHGPTALKPTGPAAKDCTAYTARQRSNPLAQLRRIAPRTRPDSAQTHWLSCEGLHRVHGPTALKPTGSAAPVPLPGGSLGYCCFILFYFIFIHYFWLPRHQACELINFRLLYNSNYHATAVCALASKAVRGGGCVGRIGSERCSHR